MGRANGPRGPSRTRSEPQLTVLAAELAGLGGGAVAAAAGASPALATGRAADRFGGVAGLVPGRRALRRARELDGEQLQSVRSGREPMGMPRAAAHHDAR